MSSKMLQLLARVGAVAFVACGVTELAHHQADPLGTAADYGIEAGFAAGLLLTLAGFYGVHLRQERDLPAFGVWAFRVAFAGQGLLGIVGLATIFRGQDALGPLFPVGVLAWAAGTVVYAVATSRAGVLGRWVAPVLAIGTLAGIAVNPGGAIVIGALWLGLASTVMGEGRALRPALEAA